MIRSDAADGEPAVQAAAVRSRLKQKLDSLLAEAENGSAALAEDYRRIEPVLAYFADVVIADSRLPYAGQWNGPLLLANDPRINIKNGREQFFLDLTATLREAGGRAAQRLAIFQTCLGLGFGGIHRGDSDKLRQFSDKILQALELTLESDRRRGEGPNRICIQAYEHTQMEELCRPVAERVWVIGIICGALLIAVMVAYFSIYRQTQQQIKSELDIITKAQ